MYMYVYCISIIYRISVLTIKNFAKRKKNEPTKRE